MMDFTKMKNDILSNIDDYKTEIYPVPIWKFYLNTQIEKIPFYIEKLFDIEKFEYSAKKSNVGGFQTNDDLMINPDFFDLVKTIEVLSDSIVLKSQYNLGKMDFIVKNKTAIMEMWGNINYKHCYNASHVHGLALSGAFYLKVPKNSGNLTFVNPAVRSDISYFRPTKNFAIIPTEGLCVIFPSWFEHYVGQNLSDEPRISISFNIGIVK